MKILLINTVDAGGAANSCIRLHLGLIGVEIQSKLLLRKKTKNTINTNQYQHNPSLKQKLLNRANSSLKRVSINLNIKEKKIKKFIDNRSSGLELYSFPFSNCDITKTKEYKEADIVHLHWVSGFLDWESFFQKNTKPIVWTLHDQNPFLGGEHYAERYLGMDEFGVPVVRNYTNDELVMDEKLLKIKKASLVGSTNINIVCPSQWLLTSSKDSMLFKSYNHHLIPYGVSSDVFRPYNKGFCKNILGLNESKISILFVADSLLNNRKGFRYLQRAIDFLVKDFNVDVEFCAIGSGSEEHQDVNIKHLGVFKDDRMMAIAYNSADIFIIPSLEDNLPNTMIEALLCGTPVIGFPTGGILETIQNGFNGIVCEEISVRSLASCIKRFLFGKIEFNRDEIAIDAKGKYNLKKQALAYKELYTKILNQ